MFLFYNDKNFIHLFNLQLIGVEFTSKIKLRFVRLNDEMKIAISVKLQISEKHEVTFL